VAIYDGGCRGDAARIGGVGLQTVRDWVLAFNAEGPAGLVNGKAPGNTPLLTAALMVGRVARGAKMLHGLVDHRAITLKFASANFTASIGSLILILGPGLFDQL